MKLINSSYLKITAYYLVFVGLSVIILWILILSGQTPEEGKVELTFHLTSEFLLALSGIVGGILLLKNNIYGKYISFFALGMILYSVLNAAGYYGEKGDAGFVFLFVMLIIITLFFLFIFFRDIKQ